MQACCPHQGKPGLTKYRYGPIEAKGGLPDRIA